MIKLITDSQRKQDIPKTDYYIVDISTHSPNYFNVEYPTTFTSGKNVIKFKFTNLLVKSVVYLEILDSNGNYVYCENTEFRYENKLLIPVHITDATPFGNITIKIAGIATQNAFTNQPIPAEFKDKYNVKWERTIPVNPMAANDTEVLFQTYPHLTIAKNFGSFTNLKYSNGRTNEIYSGSLVYTYMDSTNFSNEFEVSRTVFKEQYANNEVSDNIQLNSYDNNKVQNLNNSITISDIESKVKYYIPTIPKNYPILTLTTPFTSGSSVYFTNEVEGGIVTFYDINQPNLSFKSVNDYEYECRIVEVVDSTHVKVDVPYSRKLSNNTDYISKKTTGFANLVYSKYPEYETSKYYTNYIDISFKDVNPVIGFIDKIRIYAKSNSEKTDFKLLNEVKFEPKNLFIDSLSNINEYPIGKFISQTHVDTYWNVTGSYIVTDDNLTDSLYFNNVVASFSPKEGVTVYAKHKYQLIFNINGKKVGNNDNLVANVLLNGKKVEIAKINLKRNLRYNDITFEFETLFDSEMFPLFEINGGQWNVSNIRILPLAKFGFNPNSFQLKIPIQPLWANDEIRLRFQFVDNKGNVSKNSIDFNGVVIENYNPTYIAGDYNLITGSLYVGDDLFSGIELNGNSKAMIRSVGYNGWNRAEMGDAGFMFWSGSVKPGGYEWDLYDGVGLEVHDGGYNSLKFRTQLDQNTTGSIFEVKTDTFFFGREGQQFISGSGGEIYISSSFFQLNPNGTINATGGSVGGWSIDENKIYSITNGVGIQFENIGAIRFFMKDGGDDSSIEWYYERSTGPLSKKILNNTILDRSTFISGSITNYTANVPSIYYSVGALDFTDLQPGNPLQISPNIVFRDAESFLGYEQHRGNFIIEDFKETLITTQHLFISGAFLGGYDNSLHPYQQRLVDIMSDMTSHPGLLNHAIHTEAVGSGVNVGIYAKAPDTDFNWAGWFNGRVNIDSYIQIGGIAPTNSTTPDLGLGQFMTWDSSYIYFWVNFAWKRIPLQVW